MIVVEKIIDDQNKQVWSFNVFEFKIVLVNYRTMYKQLGKRKWNVIDKWDKYMNRQCTIKEPFLSDDIKTLALEETKKQIQVMTWEEYKS